jgi:hypothetical protein
MKNLIGIVETEDQIKNVNQYFEAKQNSYDDKNLNSIIYFIQIFKHNKALLSLDHIHVANKRTSCIQHSSFMPLLC